MSTAWHMFYGSLDTRTRRWLSFFIYQCQGNVIRLPYDTCFMGYLIREFDGDFHFSFASVKANVKSRSWQIMSDCYTQYFPPSLCLSCPVLFQVLKKVNCFEAQQLGTGLRSRRNLSDSDPDSDSGLSISTPTPTPTLLRLRHDMKYWIPERAIWCSNFLISLLIVSKRAIRQ